MKIEDILKKQGNLYKNLSSNKTIQKCNETIKPKPVKLVPYKNYEISEQEYKAITELEVWGCSEPSIVDKPSKGGARFEISIVDNKVTYLRAIHSHLGEIPEEINNLTNLQKLVLCDNYIKEIKNLDKLTNLKELDLYDNWIDKIKNLDNLRKLQELSLLDNLILKIKGLDKLQNLRKIHLDKNKISKKENKEEIKKLKKRKVKIKWKKGNKLRYNGIETIL